MGNQMGTTTLHRRDVMRAVIESSRSTGDRVAPWAGLAGLAEHFDGEDDLLVEMHREWLRVLVGRLHRGEVVAQRTPANVRDLYDEMCAAHPTLRGILDAHELNPALWEPTEREHALLARIAGLAPEGTPAENAAALGRSLVKQRIPVQRSTLR
ncbi:hypothetical protein [Nocardioides caldifontis]|uniref:hypothetical protein n=1 Tax=Nocardioides caldifontis TaxID=2588938 RepID=UPI0011DFA922|nr:hypothetical protein [Nocardioides caldifontis]